MIYEWLREFEELGGEICHWFRALFCKQFVYRRGGKGCCKMKPRSRVIDTDLCEYTSCPLSRMRGVGE